MSKSLNSTPVGEPVTVDGMWGTRKRIAKVKKFNFVLCGVKIGVFHDSELNKSIRFAPKPLLGGKAMPTFCYLQTPFNRCMCYLNRHNNLTIWLPLSNTSKVNV